MAAEAAEREEAEAVAAEAAAEKELGEAVEAEDDAAREEEEAELAEVPAVSHHHRAFLTTIRHATDIPPCRGARLCVTRASISSSVSPVAL